MRTIGVCLLAVLCAACGGGTGVRKEVPQAQKAAAPEKPAPVAAARPPDPPRKLFLWKAEKPGPPAKTVYLLGSVHVGSPDFYPLCPAIEAAYADSEALVVEVNTEALSEAEAMQVITSRAKLPEGERLDARLSPGTWGMMVQALQKYGLPADALLGFKPWFAAMTLATLRIVSAGYSPAYGIDRHFMKRKDKKTLELESMPFQIALFDELPMALQELLLKDAVEGGVQAGGEFAQAIDAWRRGDADAMQEALFSSVKAHPEFEPIYKRLILDRNRSMADTIERLQEADSALFVVVGAGHLVGKEGLVAILVEKGYSVRQLEG